MDRISGNRRLLYVGIIALCTAVNLFAQYFVNLPFKNVTVENKNGAALFSGSNLCGNPGEPALPQYTVKFLLPADADPSQVSVDLIDPVYKDLDGQFDVKPAGPVVADKKEIWPEGKRIVDGKDIDLYNKDAYFPSDFKGFISKGKIRQYGIAEAVIHPFLYNPVSKTLREITGGKVVVTIGAGKQMISAGAAVKSQTAKPNQQIEKMLERSVANFEAISTYHPTQAMQTASPSSDLYGVYVILASDADNFRGDAAIGPALNTFAQRKLQAYSDVVFVTETSAYFYASGQSTADGWAYGYGADNPDKVRDWLQNHYLSWNVTEVLIIGNPTPSLTTGIPMKWLAYPTDFYYAQLNQNWDPDGDGVIGTYNDYLVSLGALKYADVAVGRIPYYGNKQDLAKIIQKINKYETSTCRTWKQSILLPMEPLDQFVPAWHMGERIRTDIAVPAGFSSYRLYDQINPYTGNRNDLPVDNPGPGPVALPTNPENLECNEANVVSQWTTNHYGMVVWWTHGSTTAAADVFTSWDAPLLNDDFPAMTFQASCYNALPDDPNNLAYALLLNGAINTISATNVSYYKAYWVEQNGTGSNIGIGYDYTNNVITYNEPAGTALNSAKMNLPLDDGYDWLGRLEFNVYGTPDLALTYTTPQIPPEAPTVLTATAVSTSQINLTWYDNSCNEVGFRIERATSSLGPWTAIAWIASDFTYYYNTGLSQNTTYFYRVCAYNSNGNSPYSDVVPATTFQIPVLTSITVSPATSSVQTGATKQFTATGWDQFGSPLSPQPAFAWSVSGGGTISSSGLFTAGNTAGGPYTVTASSGGKSGTASVTVISSNKAPTVATAAAANPNTVTGATTALSVLGADDGGESNLVYTWSATTVPSGGSASFSVNGTNAAKNCTATFTKTGSYTLTCTIKDAGNLTVTSSVNVTVNQTLTSIVVSPSSATVNTSATQQFTAMARDQFAANLTTQPTFTWSVSGGGTISSTGLFTAGSTAGGPYTVTASSGGKSGTASVTVTGVVTTTYRINCGGSAASPFIADQYSSGGTARTVTNTINMSGVTNPAPQAVYQSERYGTCTYTLPSLTVGAKYTVRLHFAELYQTASGKRVFNVVINGTTVLSNFDIYAAAGAQYKAVVREFTATANSSGQIVINFNTVTDNSTVEGIEIIPSGPNNSPTVVTSAAANPNPATGTTAALSVLGADDGGEPNLTYTWATTGTPPAAVTFSVNGTNGAKNTTATFTKAGSYTLQATIKDAGNLTVTSAVTVTVNQALTSIVVAPASATVNTSATQQFTATARDQFAANMTTQPTFSWSVSGGGTISSSGLFTAGSTAGGPYTVTASSGGKSGTASVTVTAASLKIEAENATLAGTAAKNTNHAGYSGTGFVDGFYNSTTAKVTFTVNVPTAGSYKVNLHYSAGNGTSSNTGLYVNSTTKLKNISCAGTTNWDTWANEQETLTLNAGNNTIAYKAETSSGSCANLDYIVVSQ